MRDGGRCEVGKDGEAVMGQMVRYLICHVENLRIGIFPEKNGKMI